jgi:HAMP domain-containing protein
MTSRILAALLTLTGGLLLGALLPLGLAMAHQQNQDYRTGTLSIAHTLAAAAEERIADRENSTMLPRTLAELRTEDAGGATMTVAVIDDDGHLVEGGNTGLYTPTRAAPALAGRTLLTRDGNRLLAAVPVNGHTEKVAGAVLLSRSLGPLHERVTMLWTRLAVVALLAVAAAVVLAVALARWVGRPLRNLEHAAEALGTGELGARAEPPRRPVEIRSLAQRFNVMAARLQSLIHDHKTMLADVSHQLRTPRYAFAWNSSPPTPPPIPPSSRRPWTNSPGWPVSSTACSRSLAPTTSLNHPNPSRWSGCWPNAPRPGVPSRPNATCACRTRRTPRSPRSPSRATWNK